MMDGGDNKKIDDAELSAVLQKWRMSGKTPADFKRSVWSRISSVDSSGKLSNATAFREWIYSLCLRPAIVASFLVMACLLGSGIGLIHAKRKSDNFTESMQERYVRWVNPNFHTNR